MIGNDVVDLGDGSVAEGARHPRFDQRVFARDERAALAASGAPNRLRWIFWAAKEAAYKVAKKLDPKAVWSPARFVVQIGSDLTGFVHHGASRFHVRVDEDGRRVHAVASDVPLDPAGYTARVAWHPAGRRDERSAARALALLGISESLGVAPAELAIGKEGRIPFVTLRGERAPVDVSLSHHGRFVAFACDRAAAAVEEAS